MLQSQQTLQNRYRLQKQLGTNHTRQTWIAEDIESQQQVVVKLLPFSPQTQWQDVKLFEREAQVLQHLNHPCIPRYLDYFSLEKEAGGGLPWFALVQEYIPGSSLQQVLKEGKSFTEAETKEIAKQLLEILIHLHELSPPVLHRDIKPSNLIALSSEVENSHQPSLTASPRPRVSVSASPRQLATSYYLVDFGAVQERAKAEGVTFTVVGTGGYAPPEQLWGKAVAASDLYALGATLVHLLTGIAPGKLPQRKMRLQFRDKVTLSPEFARWLDKLLDPAVEKRFGQARQALEALKAIEKEEKAEKVSFGRLGRLALMQYGIVGLCALALPLFAAYRYIHEGRIHLSAVNRSQEDYLSQHKWFADSIRGLGNKISPNTQHYNYSVQATPLYSLNYATPRFMSDEIFNRRKKVKGYVGIVAIISEDSKTGKLQTKTVICETTRTGRRIKKQMYIANEAIQCPPGTKVLKTMKEIVVGNRAAKLAYNALEAANVGKPDIALLLAKKIEGTSIRDRTLASIAPHLHTEKQVNTVLQIIQSVQYSRYKSSILSALAENLKTKQQIATALQVILSIQDRHYKDVALYTIANAMKKEQQIETVLQFIQSLQEDNDKFYFLLAIVRNLKTEKQINAGLQITQYLQEKKHQELCLKEIAPHLQTEKQIDTALQIVQAFTAQENKRAILLKIANNLKTGQQVNTALQISKSIQNEDHKKGTWHEIAENIKTEQQIEGMLQFIQAIEEDADKSFLLSEIVHKIETEQQIDAVLQMAQSVQHKRDRASVLSVILEITENLKTEQQVETVIQIIESLQGSFETYRVFYRNRGDIFYRGRYKITTKQQIEGVLQFTRSLQDDEHKYRVLSAIASNINTEQQFETALQIVKSFQKEDNKILTLSAIANNINTVQKFDIALEAAQSLPESKEKQIFLNALKQNLETLKKEEEARKKIWITL